MAFTQSDKDRIGLNPNLQSIALTGDEYYYHLFGGVRWYFGSGNPQGELSAPIGSICVTDEGMFFCNGNGSGAAGTVWFGQISKPFTATLVAGVQLSVTHTLGHVAQVWAVDDNGNEIGVEVTAITTSGFKVDSLISGTVYYR